MLTVVCPHCNAQGRAPDKLAGRTVPCPKCKQPLTVPLLPADDDVMNVLNEPAPKSAKPEPVRQLEQPTKSKWDDDQDEAPYGLADEPKFEAPKPKSTPKPTKLGAFSGGTFERDEDSAFEPTEKPKKKKKSRRKSVAGTSHDPRGEPRMWLFALTLLPLLIFAVVQPKSPIERLAENEDALVEAEEAIDKAAPDLKKDESGDIDANALNDLIRRLPNQRVPGAHLSRDSYVHWAYAVVATLFFLGGISLLFPTGDAKPSHLILVGIATGTVGIFALLAFQWIAFRMAGFMLIGRSILVLLFFIVKFIAWSYMMGYATDGPFLMQWIGFTFGVGLCEEFVKAAPLLIFISSARKTLDWRSMRAWGLASGAGFGISEAIHYAGGYYNGVAGGDIYLIRFVSCVGFHAILTAGSALLLFNNADEVCDSEWYGIIGNTVFYLMPAMLLHGLYNTLVTRDHNLLAFFVGVASFLWVVWLSGRTRSGAD